MNINPSPKIRLAIYIFSGLSSLAVGYAQSKHYIGVAEVTLWTGFVAIVNGLSAVNVSNK